jgi:DNA-binding response OmpR family regulator
MAAAASNSRAASMPDVILMDINLPGISGVEAMRILRRDPATAHIPVVALSANAMPRDIEKGLEAGFFRYLTKPIKVSEFMDTLDVALKFAASTQALPTKGNSHEAHRIRHPHASILIVDDQEANVACSSSCCCAKPATPTSASTMIRRKSARCTARTATT